MIGLGSAPKPWNCSACGHLMYNLSTDGFPIPGAPKPRNYNLTYPMVCSVCWDMLSIVYGTNGGSQYWLLVESEVQARRKKIDPLRPGGNYFV